LSQVGDEALRKFALVSAVAGLALIAIPVVAAVSDTVRTRIAGYRELGAAFKGANDGLRGEPQIVLLQQSARQIGNAAKQQYAWFPLGSGAQVGVTTAAKATIWTDPKGFKAVQDSFARQAEVFKKSVSSGNAATIRAEARKLGGTCKACHDKYRNKVD
jgi:cytochrome c556